LLADDHWVVADALKSLLTDRCEVVGVATDGRALIHKARELKPDLIVADISMPLLNGIQAAEQLKRSLPQVRFVFLTMMDDPKLAAAALRLAPVGYVLKNSAADELLTAIDHVMQGRTYVTARVKPEAALDQKQAAETALKKLTPRQRDVLQLFAQGHAMKEIADILQISERTVEFHKYHIMEVFQLRANTELVLLALKHGLISQ
jgi:DNA-binding NarL/FixJ family response regulator